MEGGTVSIVSTSPPATTGARTRIRVLAVAGAVAAALVAFTIAKALVGDLRQPGFGNGAPQPLSAGAVVIAALLASLLGWALLALLQRRTTNPRRAWMIVAPLALLGSLAGPLSGHGISAANRLALVLLHIAVAAVLIPLYHRSLPQHTPRGQRRA